MGIRRSACRGVGDGDRTGARQAADGASRVGAVGRSIAPSVCRLVLDVHDAVPVDQKGKRSRLGGWLCASADTDIRFSGEKDVQSLERWLRTTGFAHGVSGVAGRA